MATLHDADGTPSGGRSAKHVGLLVVGLALAGCAGQSESTKTALSPQCDMAVMHANLFDENQDYAVAPGEWTTAFRHMDMNGDGQLSSDEMAKACAEATTKAAR